MKIPENIKEMLCCPVCKCKLQFINSRLECVSGQCGSFFPVVEGIPVLINESASLFSVSDFLNKNKTTIRRQSKIEGVFSSILPGISLNIKAEQNYAKFAELLLERDKNPKVLVIGGSVAGQGIKEIISNPSIQLIETDVSFGPRTALVCDAHDIPFEDNSLDGVIIQAVLDDVLDPFRCVGEIHRVLKENGLVYAEIPFMQQVHSGRYDFTRFTHLGVLRLFRKFEEICSGASGGPGTALAWAYQYFLLSFVRSKASRALIKGFGRLTSFWLKYFDYLLIDRQGALDAASGYYFMGKKSMRVLTDSELIQKYRGAQG